jgi:hypothetical protein
MNDLVMVQATSLHGIVIEFNKNYILIINNSILTDHKKG